MRGAVACEPIGYQRSRQLSEEVADGVTTDAMFWARVRCEPFEPRFETRTRKLLTVAEARALPLWSHPLAARQLDRALAVEQRARRPHPRSGV